MENKRFQTYGTYLLYMEPRRLTQYWYRSTGWTTGVHFPAGAMLGFFSSPPLQNRLWGPPRLLVNGFRG